MNSLKHNSSNRLSGYRTHHEFLHYASFRSIEEFSSLLLDIQKNDLPVYILGKGSNTWFASRRVHTAVLKNELPEFIEIQKEDDCSLTLRVSSATPIMRVLRFCEKRGFDCFYFLASVPGNIGGALAMNAGGPPHTGSIFDFVDSIDVFEDNMAKTHTKAQIPIGYRHTPYTGVQPKLIISACFTFNKKSFEISPIKERIEWYKRFQDTSGPSLGSVFSSGNGYIYGALKRLRFGIFGSQFSGKYPNWIVCKKGSLFGIRLCVVMATILHRMFSRQIVIEIVRVK
jgi:UDP-N-acetylmuramate dehydrogenase